MLGSALETLLILMVNCYPDEAEGTGVAPKTKGVVRPLLEWTLAELVRGEVNRLASCRPYTW